MSATDGVKLSSLETGISDENHKDESYVLSLLPQHLLMLNKKQ
jgi:hypothetical protein